MNRNSLQVQNEVKPDLVIIHQVFEFEPVLHQSELNEHLAPPTCSVLTVVIDYFDPEVNLKTWRFQGEFVCWGWTSEIIKRTCFMSPLSQDSEVSAWGSNIDFDLTAGNFDKYKFDLWMRYLYFTWGFPFSATLNFHSTTCIWLL